MDKSDNHENYLIELLSACVRQDFEEMREQPGVYTTSFLTAHKAVLMELVRLGVMEELYPEEKYGERWERLYYAKFRK